MGAGGAGDSTFDKHCEREESYLCFIKYIRFTVMKSG